MDIQRYICHSGNQIRDATESRKMDPLKIELFMCEWEDAGEQILVGDNSVMFSSDK